MLAVYSPVSDYPGKVLLPGVITDLLSVDAVEIEAVRVIRCELDLGIQLLLDLIRPFIQHSWRHQSTEIRLRDVAFQHIEVHLEIVELHIIRNLNADKGSRIVRRHKRAIRNAPRAESKGDRILHGKRRTCSPFRDPEVEALRLITVHKERVGLIGFQFEALRQADIVPLHRRTQPAVDHNTGAVNIADLACREYRVSLVIHSVVVPCGDNTVPVDLRLHHGDTGSGLHILVNGEMLTDVLQRVMPFQHQEADRMICELLVTGIDTGPVRATCIRLDIPELIVQDVFAVVLAVLLQHVAVFLVEVDGVVDGPLHIQDEDRILLACFKVIVLRERECPGCRTGADMPVDDGDGAVHRGARFALRQQVAGAVKPRPGGGREQVLQPDLVLDADHCIGIPGSDIDHVHPFTVFRKGADLIQRDIAFQDIHADGMVSESGLHRCLKAQLICFRFRRHKLAVGIRDRIEALHNIIVPKVSAEVIGNHDVVIQPGAPIIDKQRIGFSRLRGELLTDAGYRECRAHRAVHNRQGRFKAARRFHGHNDFSRVIGGKRAAHANQVILPRIVGEKGCPGQSVSQVGIRHVGQDVILVVFSFEDIQANDIIFILISVAVQADPVVAGRIGHKLCIPQCAQREATVASVLLEHTAVRGMVEEDAARRIVFRRNIRKDRIRLTGFKMDRFRDVEDGSSVIITEYTVDHNACLVRFPDSFRTDNGRTVSASGRCIHHLHKVLLPDLIRDRDQRLSVIEDVLDVSIRLADMLAKVSMGRTIRIRPRIEDFRVCGRLPRNPIHAGSQGSVRGVQVGDRFFQISLRPRKPGIHILFGGCVIIPHSLFRGVVISSDRLLRCVIISQDCCLRRIVIRDNPLLGRREMLLQQIHLHIEIRTQRPVFRLGDVRTGGHFPP